MLRSVVAIAGIVVLLVGCGAPQPDSEGAGGRTVAGSASLFQNFQLPGRKQGISVSPRAMSTAEHDARYEALRSVGFRYRQYNVWWSALEPLPPGCDETTTHKPQCQTSASSPEMLSCPSGTVMVPRDEAERSAKGYHRYRCISLGMVSHLQDVFRRDAAAGMQTAIVVWSSPVNYRNPGCEGFAWADGLMKQGCAPRRDALDDYEDIINALASHFNGGPYGKISHLIVWNENASDSWFDTSPVVKKGDTSAAAVNARIDTYAEMMKRTHSAMARHLSGALLYASTDMLWEPNIVPGHLGTRVLLEGLWRRLKTDIPWGVAVHPYEDPTVPPRDAGVYTFYNLELVANFQRDQLRRHGIDPDHGRQPQLVLLASEQGWPRGGQVTIEVQARNICAAHAKVMNLPEVIAVAHNYFHSVEPQEDDPNGHSGQGAWYGLLPHTVKADLSNALDYATGKAYVATASDSFGKDAHNYCCATFGYGCPDKLPPVPAGSDLFEVTGTIDGLVTDDLGTPIVKGWACAKGVVGSIAVHLYRNGAAGSGVLVEGYPATGTSEGAVGNACGTSFGAYRFSIPLSETLRREAGGQKLWLYGISPVGRQPRQLANSGKLAIPALDNTPPAGPCNAQTQPAPEWGVKNGQCLQSCGALGGTVTFSSPCADYGKVDVGQAYDVAYCCKDAPPSPPPPPGPCNAQTQPAPHWGVKNGQCLQSCGALGGTVTFSSPCADYGKVDVGQAYDVAYCCKDAPPPPPPPADVMVKVYRHYNPAKADHWLSLSSTEAGYALEGVAFEVYRDSATGRRQLYGCAVNGEHFVSRWSNCEGQQALGALGWVAETQSSKSSRAISRCRNAQSYDHLITANPNECASAGYSFEETLGYVP